MAQDGQAEALDGCGGHEHAGVAEYHYHPEVSGPSSCNEQSNAYCTHLS
jgi:hypothetical protein